MRIPEDVIDDGVDVRDVHLAVAVDVTNKGALISIARHAGMAATATSINNNVNGVVGIGNGYLAITIHIARYANCCISNDL